MPLQFLAPIFFAALAALAVPVIIHLIQKERKEALQFPSLMFLRQVPYKSVRRRRIRNWFLFALRCAVLVLLIAAFARPFMDRGAEAANTLDTSREVVVLLDRSYSMGYGNRWQRAVDAARATVDGLGAQDQATIVYFDAGAGAAGQATTDKLRLRSALDSARLGSGATRYGPALKLAQSILEASDFPNREVVLISDFQRVGWDGDVDVRLPPGTKLRPVLIGDSVTANVAVTGVTFKREQVSGRERVSATARLANKSAKAVRDLPVELELDGREAQTVQVSLGPNSAAVATFAPFTLPVAGTRGTVSAGEDQLSADNRFHFVLSPGQSISVLVVDGGEESASLYVRRALALGERPAFRVDALRSGQLRASALAGRDVVILNDAPFPAGEFGRRLRAFVEAGGGLIMALGDRGGANGWGAAADLLPGSPLNPADRAGAGGTLGYLDYAHPVFELFSAPRSGDFTASHFFRYRPVNKTDSATVLARFDDGAAALFERKVGTGRILVWSSSLDTYWNDLPLQPVFLPFVHRLVQYAAGYGEPNPWFTVAQVIDVARLDTASVAANTDSAAAQAPRREGRPAVVMTPRGTRLNVDRNGLVRLEEQGFYEVRRPGSDDEEPVAVNLDMAESDLAALDPQEVASAVEPRGDEAARAGLANALPIEERERKQGLWWYFLVVALLLLAAETAVSNRLSRRRRLAES
jgi:hypothetical protein